MVEWTVAKNGQQPEPEWQQARCHRRRSDCRQPEARVRGVTVATPQGRGVVLAKMVVDSTGNADIAAMRVAGVDGRSARSATLHEHQSWGSGRGEGRWRREGER